MFGISKKNFKAYTDGMLEIIGIHHKNVDDLQQALVHLGTAVEGMNELVEVQNKRIELLEEALHELIKPK